MNNVINLNTTLSTQPLFFQYSVHLNNLVELYSMKAVKSLIYVVLYGSSIDRFYYKHSSSAFTLVDNLYQDNPEAFKNYVKQMFEIE